MNTAKDDEEFWYSTEKRSFCFESNEVGQLFGATKVDTNKLWTDIPASTSEGYLKLTDDIQTLKPLLCVISERTLSCILAADKLQDTSLESANDQPNVTLKKIMFGQPYSLESYKSLASKTALLDAAVASGNGNAILIISIFLIKTLKKSLVHRLLIDKPDAVHVYIHYLSTRLQINEVTDTLTMLGQSINSAMKTLHIIIKNTRDPDRLLQKLKNCYKTQFSALNNCKETQFLQSYIQLLEWQIGVKNTEFTDKIKINSSVMDCLYYICKDHWDSTHGSLMSPTTFSQQHDISTRQYQKVALQVKAASGDWHNIDCLLLTKGWLGSKKLQTQLHIEDVLKILHKYHASAYMLDKYLKYVSNIERRLELAKNLHCYKTAIDTLVLQGDRAALMEYKTKLKSQSEEYFYAESAVRLPSVKWKN